MHPTISASQTVHAAPIQNKGELRKRVADDDSAASSEKRPKLQPDMDVDLKGIRPVHHVEGSNFLELPAELRNHIYEYAAEYAYRCFPALHPGSNKFCKGVVSISAKEFLQEHERKTIPYLALTHTCVQIRDEFRPMWLSTPKIPLSSMTTYLKTFFPTRLPKATCSERRVLGTSSLRVYIRWGELNIYHLNDVTSLVKFKARFPGCAITCQSLPCYTDSLLRDLDRIVNNDNAAWLQSLLRGRISQVRVGLHAEEETNETTVAMDLVVKEKFAEPWMKGTLKPPPDHVVGQFLRQFGLELESLGWKVQVFVDYS